MCALFCNIGRTLEAHQGIDAPEEGGAQIEVQTQGKTFVRVLATSIGQKKHTDTSEHPRRGGCTSQSSCMSSASHLVKAIAELLCERASCTDSKASHHSRVQKIKQHGQDTQVQQTFYELIYISVMYSSFLACTTLDSTFAILGAILDSVEHKDDTVESRQPNGLCDDSLVL